MEKTNKEKLDEIIGRLGKESCYGISLTELREKLEEYNTLNNTNFEITHNGCELWVYVGNLIDSSKDEFSEIFKFIQNNNFLHCRPFPWKPSGIYLGHPDCMDRMGNAKKEDFIDDYPIFNIDRFLGK